jgi:FkbM family methyltransferase
VNASNAEPAATAGTRKTSALHLKIREGLTVAVPPSLSAISTYVLLEQEEWFEKEINLLRQFLKPGMTAIDIGANLGLYSLPMARLVGPDGRVFSYEPGSEARAFLERSRELNGFSNLDVVGAALSDNDREGHLAFAGSTELRSLGDAGTGEPVRITSLDLESAVRPWSSVDFIKIDAEGEEERIITGGQALLATHSPLVMFEIKAGEKVNERLRAIFPTIGYRVFRQLAGAPILVPDDATTPLDGYELNLFAAKPDRVNARSQQGLLVDALSGWIPGEADRNHAVAFWQRQTFAALLDASGAAGSSADAEYQDALTAYAIWRATDQPVATRCAALAFALQRIRLVCARACTAERASTWARIAWEWGGRSESVGALRRLMQILSGARLQLKEPFWPADARFDDVAPGDQPAAWLAAAAAERFERTFSFSSLFSGASPFLSWLCGQKFASAEMERRRTLIAAHAGQQPRVPERLCVPAPDHLNADIWRAGLVPGTAV